MSAQEADPAVARSPRRAVAEAALGGAIAAGLGLAVLVTIWGPGPLFIFRLSGATFVGPRALVGGFWVIVWGVLLYALVCLAFALLFVWLLGHRVDGARALMGGISVALAGHVLMVSLVLPVMNPWLRDRIVISRFSFLAIDLLFGLGLAIGAGWRRRYAAFGRRYVGLWARFGRKKAEGEAEAGPHPEPQPHPA